MMMKQSVGAALVVGLALSGGACKGQDHRVPKADTGNTTTQNVTPSTRDTGTETRMETRESSRTTASDTGTSDVTSTDTSTRHTETGTSLPESRSASRTQPRAHRGPSAMVTKRQPGAATGTVRGEESSGMTCAECTPPATKGQTSTEQENLKLSGTQKSVACSDSKHAHARFLRPDLAYSLTGVDCEGNKPSNVSQNKNFSERTPAGECANDPHAHAMFLRPDMAYEATGKDCQGDKPSSRSIEQ